MKNHFIKIRHRLPAILTVTAAALFVITHGCPIKLLTGISCPGCGMTRALLALSRLDFSLAAEMHPLVFLIPVAVLVYFFRRLIPKRALMSLCVLALILLAAVYIIRLTGQSAVVCADYESGIIYRILNKLL